MQDRWIWRRWSLAAIFALSLLSGVLAVATEAATRRPDPAAQRRLDDALRQLNEHRQQMQRELNFDRIEMECYRRQLREAMECARERVEVATDMLVRAENALAQSDPNVPDPELLLNCHYWTECLATAQSCIEQVRRTCQERVDAARQRYQADNLRWRGIIRADEQAVEEAKRALRRAS